MAKLNLGDRMLIESGFIVTTKYSEDEKELEAASVIVIKDGKILCGSRRSSEGLCGPGGHIEEGETPEDAVLREAQEEFDIVPLNILPVGVYKGSTGSYCDTMVYFTDQFTGTPKADGGEMLNERWLSLEELNGKFLFPPFEESVKMLTNLLTSGDGYYNVTSEDGGPGSGRYPKGSGKKNGQLSPEGRNKPCTGFRDKAAAKRHEKHWAEFGFASSEQYEKAAIKFLQQPVGGDIDGYLRAKDNAIIRFNVKTTEFAIGHPGAEVVTYYKAKFKNGKARPDQANDYFNHIKKEEMYEEDAQTTYVSDMREI